MADEYRAAPIDDLGDIYGRLKRPSDGARWNGTVWNELGTSALSAYSQTLTRSTDFEDEVFCDRPAGVGEDEEVVLEVLLGDGGSPTAADRLIHSQLQGPGVEELLDALGEVASDVTDIKAEVERDLITADTDFRRDTSQDEYTIIWRRNEPPVTSGITGTPTIQVQKRADGTDLIAQTAMTAISTGVYKFDTATRLTAGEAALVTYKATIDGLERTWKVVVGRDVSS